MLLLLETTLSTFIFLLGACIFSFLNVIIWRLPRHMDFVSGHSICTTCGHRLSYLDMVPILSWLFLGGKCRYCKAKISPRYALVESIGGLTALLCVHQFGYTSSALTAFTFIGILTVTAWIDYDTMEIPDSLSICAFLLGLISILTLPLSGVNLAGRIIGMVCISVPMLILTIVVPGAFGGGDMKLMAGCGFFLGWKLTLAAFFLAVLTGGGEGILLLLRKKAGRKDHFAFGPHLCFGMGLSLFFGNELIRWYLGLMGL